MNAEELQFVCFLDGIGPDVVRNELAHGRYSGRMRRVAEDWLRHQPEPRREVYMSGSSKYSITGGNQGAVGDDARAANFTQISNSSTEPLDLGALSDELARLRKALKQLDTDADQDADIGALAVAETAAKNGDQNAVIAALAKVGRWVFDKATEIGVTVAAEALKRALLPSSGAPGS